MIYPIVVFGDPVLRKKAAEITQDNVDVKSLSEEMFATMEAANGIGLAAPQIGKSIRVFVVDGTPLEEEELMDFKRVFVNPKMLDENGQEWSFEEGCLSIPEIREEVFRKQKIRISFLDENWESHEEEFDGIKARIIQHEYDHLEGILFTDYLTNFKKRVLKGKLANISKGKVKTDYKISYPIKKK